MTIFEQCFEWHPKLAIYPLAQNHLRLLSESQQLVLSRAQFEPFNQLIEANMPLSAWTMQQTMNKAMTMAQQLELHQNLGAMLDAGYMQAAGQSDNNRQYYTPDFGQQPLVLKDHGNWPQIQLLSQYDKLDLSLDWLRRVAHNPGVNLVIVDDYLDPRLQQINRHYLQTGQPWLLLKLTGEAPLVGPYFTGVKSGVKSQPCWQCLNHRMRANAGVRWVQCGSPEQDGAPPLTVPVRYDETLVDGHINAMMGLLEQLLKDSDSECFYQLNDSAGANVGEPVCHPVIHRPQCPCCGSADLYQRQTSQPVVLQSNIKLTSTDGGVRTITPQATVEHLKKVISPLSGLLTHLKTSSLNDQQGSQQGSQQGKQYHNVIYRSGFSQCPRNLSYLSAPLSNNSFSYTTTGKGISVPQSKASGLGEGIERLAAQYQGDEISHHGVAPPDDGDYILPQQLTPFSVQQYDHFVRPSCSEVQAGYQLYAVKKHQPDIPLHWTPVWSLATQYQHYVPLSFCYANSPFEEQQYSRFYHNGGSAGNTLEEAVLQGFLEIIERDAVAVWWYNRLQRPGIDFADMNGDLLIQLEHTLAGDWQYWALDLTHDFNIPVVAAISRHKTRHTFCFGFGCHLDVQIACQRAFTELCQITEIRDNNVAPFDFDQIPVGDYLFASTGGTQRFSDFQSPKNTDIKADIEYCVTQAVRLKLDPLVLNYSRPDMLLKTAKVIIPGSCHIFPYLAAARLYTVPVSMGWLAEAKTEAQLNPQALLI